MAIDQRDDVQNASPFIRRVAPAIAANALALLTCAATTADAQQAASTGSGDSAPSQPAFDVWEYRVSGNTTLPATDVERAVYPFLGPGKTIADVETARQSLEKAYHDAGFGTVFVDIPEQSTSGGIVRLNATEGRLDRVRITGARYFSNGQIRESLPSLASGSVPNLPQVQSEIAALNRATPDRSVVPVLRAGREPGTVDVELKVDDKAPLHASLELNDRYSVDTTRTRLLGSVSYDNLFQTQHSLSLQYQTAPEKPSDVQAWVATYVFKVPQWHDTAFVIYGVDSQTDVAAFGTQSVLGNGQIYGARAILPLPESSAYTHSLALGVDYKDFLEDIRLEDDVQLTTPIDYVNWSATYTGNLRTERTLTTLSLAANFGMRGIGNDSIEFADKRYRGEPNYWYLRGSVQQTRQLPASWQMLGRASIQVATGPLVSNEQFSLGGADTVRGYPEAIALGDDGINLGVELRRALPATWLGAAEGTAYVLAFTDAGLVTTANALPGQDDTTGLGSAGLGLRLVAWHGFDAALDWAWALRAMGDVQAGDQRILFSLRYGF